MLIYGMIYGQIGAGYGAHYQFWHDDILIRFGASAAVTLLLGILGMLAFFLDQRPLWTAALIDDYFGSTDPRLRHRRGVFLPDGGGFTSFGCRRSSGSGDSFVSWRGRF